MQRHEILRTEFRVVEGTPVQIVQSQVPLRIEKVDLRQLDAAKRQVELHACAEQALIGPFDLAHAPLFRATFFHLTDDEQVIFLSTHRIVCDEASLEILLSEIHSYCQAEFSGKSTTSEVVRQYQGVASSEASASDISYWTKRLAGAPFNIDLPFDYPRPPVQTFTVAHQKMRLTPDLVDRLQGLSQRHGVTCFTTMIAAFSVLLSRYARQEDLVLGTRVSGRERPEFEHVIGPLENMVALRGDLSGDPTFADLLKRMHEVVDGALGHQGVPFETVVRELRLERDMSRHPVFQILLTLKEKSVGPFEPGVTLFELDRPAGQFDLSIDFAEEAEDLEARFSFNTDLFDSGTITRMMEHFRILLEAAATDPDARISTMPLLSEAERQQLLVEWNDTAVEYPRDIPLHKLIEEQVEKNPDSIALIYESEQLSYQQLNGRANQLAHYLQQNGVGPDVLVAVCANDLWNSLSPCWPR